MSKRAISASRAAKKKSKPKKKTKTKRKAKTMAKKRYRGQYKKKSRRRRSSGGTSSLKEKGMVGVAAAAYGYVRENTDYISKVPVINSMDPGMKQDAALGIAAHFIAKKWKSKWADRAGVALFALAGDKFGKAKFTISGDGDVGFDDPHVMDGDEIAGEIAG